ncbi:hypothetical protein KIPB_014353, partial [Kipferlia bialata]
LLMLPVTAILVHNMIRKEERYLESKHGETYREYCSKVPRYILF